MKPMKTVSDAPRSVSQSRRIKVATGIALIIEIIGVIRLFKSTKRWQRNERPTPAIIPKERPYKTLKNDAKTTV